MSKCKCGGKVVFKFYMPTRAMRVYECKKCGAWRRITDRQEEEKLVKEKVIFT